MITSSKEFKSNSISSTGDSRAVYMLVQEVKCYLRGITVCLPLRYQQGSESGPPASTEVDLFISTQRIKVLSAYTQVHNRLRITFMLVSLWICSLKYMRGQLHMSCAGQACHCRCSLAKNCPLRQSDRHVKRLTTAYFLHFKISEQISISIFSLIKSKIW